MLYDVLPPLVFFTSLGGIILIVLRVVLRVRKAQFTQGIQAVIQNSGSERMPKTEELARIIGPNNKGVRVIKNRVALSTQQVREAGSRLTALLRRRHADQDRRRRRFSTAALAGRVRHAGQQGRSVLLTQTRALQEKVSRRRNTEDLANEEKSDAGGQGTTTVKSPRLVIRQDEPQQKPAGMFRKGAAKKKMPALTQAGEALSAGKAEKAESILVPYLAKHPRATAAYMMLGEAAMMRRNWTEAMEIFEEVVQLNENVPGSFAALGRAAYQAGKITRAVEALQRAHNANPQDPVIIKQLLTIARRMDNEPMQRSLREELQAIKAIGAKESARQNQTAQGG